MEITTFLYIALGAFALLFLAVWIEDILRRKRTETAPVTLFQAILGFVTNFFDTLGIGSYAPTTSIFKIKKMVPDEVIPGTLNIGHTFPVVVMAFLYITSVDIEPITLISMIGASILGAWLGAGVVAGLPRRKVQIGMGCALLVAAGLMFMKQIDFFASLGGETLSLEGPMLWLGIAGNFVLGALMTIGIGMYAPCMILVSFLGMSPLASFPIMMGSCAFLMPVAGIKFVRKGSYSLNPALGLALGGIPAVYLAYSIVTSLDLVLLRWLVIVVVLYTSIAMLRSALQRS